MPPGADPQIIFNVIPPSSGKAYLILLIVMCLCQGALTMELLNHLRFDVRLMRKPGWTDPAKLISRLAYFICRYLSVTILGTIICFITLKSNNCTALPMAFQIMGMFLLDAVLLLFVQRTMALYNWSRNVTIPLSVFYCLVVVSSAICTPFYGVGFRIPHTEFCAFDTRSYLTRTVVANVVFRSLSISLDTVMLLLTLHRLLDGGLKAVWHKKPQQLFTSLHDSSLSGFLIRQGLHFFVLQLGTDIFFLTTYFSFTENAYKDLGTAFAFTIPPIAAAAAFRDVGKKVPMFTAKRPTKVNEIIASDDTPSGGISARTGTANTRNSAVEPNAAVLTAPAAPGTPTRVNAFVLQARSNLGFSGSPSPEKTTSRVSWAAGRKSINRFRPDPVEEEDSGVLITVGTVSRIDDAGQGWEAGSPRYSSDNDPYAIQMRRQWPNLATQAAAGSEAVAQCPDGDDAKEKDLELGDSGSENLHIPTLLSVQTAAGSPRLAHVYGTSIESSSSSWQPSTPDSPHEPVLHSPSAFSRKSPPSTADAPSSRASSTRPDHHAVIEEEEIRLASDKQ
ncbi:hypothetical protein PHBOTO_000853 [Pseudozyma hubeiensis]|nr:hypothetical protein PHBOTO_000853 [Pseudozyma hubeiensis]